MREGPVRRLIYDQTCATERPAAEAARCRTQPSASSSTAGLRGCGDCGEKFCVAVLPKETEFGRKREIDQSNCNKDAPAPAASARASQIHGGALKKCKGSGKQISPHCRNLSSPPTSQPWASSSRHRRHRRRRSALIGMAAHLEKGATVLDQTGLVQKGGAASAICASRYRRQPRGAHRCGQADRARLRHGRRRRLLGAIEDPRRPLTRGAEHLRGDARHVHDLSRHGVSGAADSGRGEDRARRPGARARRRDRAGQRTARRFDREQPVHARLRLAERLGSAESRRADARDRAQRRRGRNEQDRVQLGPPCGARHRAGARSCARQCAGKNRRDSCARTRRFAPQRDARRRCGAPRRVPHRLPGRGICREVQDADRQGPQRRAG